MEKLLVFALLHEAAATIDRLKAKQTDSNLYTFDGGEIVICGLGIHAAQSSVSEHIHKCDEVWNLGLAGALTEELPLTTLVAIGRVTKYVPVQDLDSHSQNLMEEHLIPFELGGEYSLTTSDFPIHTKEHRPPKCHLVDMEGYGIAFAARHLGKKCRMWKIVSDFASPGGVQLIKQNREYYSKLLAKKVEDESSRYS